MTNWRAPSLIGTAAIVGLAIAGCGSSSSSKSSSTAPPAATTPPATAAPPAGTAGASVARLSADPSGALKFNVSTLHAKAGTVTMQMLDPSGSGVPHGISVQGHGVDKDSTVVQPGGTATVTVSLKPGTYSFYCPVPGHEAAGMKGTLVVT